jgi:hypothetical protein
MANVKNRLKPTERLHHVLVPKEFPPLSLHTVVTFLAISRIAAGGPNIGS